MADCLIGLGSNLGNRAANLEAAIQQFCGHPQIVLQASSRFLETDPIGGPTGQDAFLNAALRVHAQLDPTELLDWSQQIESQLGRQRAERWGPRLIDIDLLLYDELVWETAELTLPHPRMAVRRFVLEPAHEIAADMVHAPTGWNISRLFHHLCEPTSYVALAGIDAEIRRQFAESLAKTPRQHLLLDPSEKELSCWPCDGSERECRAVLDRVARRLELLKSVEEQVDRDPDCFVISDFWLNQTLVVARTCFHGEVRQRIESACHAALEGLRIPKMIFFLDAPRSSAAKTDRVSANVSNRPVIGEELRRQVTLPDQGAVIRVDSGNVEWAQLEFSAALDAMQ